MGTGSTGSEKQGASCRIDVETNRCYRGDIRIFNFRLSRVGSLSEDYLDFPFLSFRL